TSNMASTIWIKTIAIAMRPKSPGVSSRARMVSEMKSSAFAPIRATTKAPLAVAVRWETASLRVTRVRVVANRMEATEASRQGAPPCGKKSDSLQYNHGTVRIKDRPGPGVCSRGARISLGLYSRRGGKNSFQVGVEWPEFGRMRLSQTVIFDFQ